MSAALFSLEGHTAAVTGPTRGIGQAIAIALAEAGADLILIQVRSPAAAPAARLPPSSLLRSPLLSGDLH